MLELKDFDLPSEYLVLHKRKLNEMRTLYYNLYTKLNDEITEIGDELERRDFNRQAI